MNFNQKMMFMLASDPDFEMENGMVMKKILVVGEDKNSKEFYVAGEDKVAKLKGLKMGQEIIINFNLVDHEKAIKKGVKNAYKIQVNDIMPTSAKA